MKIVETIILQYILGYVLQGLAFILGIYAFNKLKLEKKQYLVASVIFIVFSYLMRLLPISFGVHTILDLICVFLLGVLFIKTPVFATIRSLLAITVLLLVTELLNVLLMTSVLGQQKFDSLMNDPISKYYVGLPAAIVFALLIALSYCILVLKKKKSEKIGKKANELSEKIAAQLNYDEDKKAVIAYGLIAIFQTVAIAVITSVFGLMGHFLYEGLAIFLGVGILKKSTGGAHSQTMYGCMLISVFSITFMAILARYVFSFPVNIYLNLAISVLIFALCFFVFYRRVPVDSPNKPITNPAKIKRLRSQSFVLLTVYTAISIILLFFASANPRFYSITAAIRFVSLWQALMLSDKGINFIKLIDSKFTVKEVWN